jgi:hypothetical protein
VSESTRNPPLGAQRCALAEIDGEVRRGGGAAAVADDEELRVAIADVSDRVDDAGDLLAGQRSEGGVELGEIAADELEGHGRDAQVRVNVDGEAYVSAQTGETAARSVARR